MLAYVIIRNFSLSCVYNEFMVFCFSSVMFMFCVVVSYLVDGYVEI